MLRLVDPDMVDRLVHKMKDAKPIAAHPGNVLRAFGRDPLPSTEPCVEYERDRLRARRKLSPVFAARRAPDQDDIWQGFHALSGRHKLGSRVGVKSSPG